MARIPDSISIAEIIGAVNESIDATNCSGQGDCQQGEMCLTHHLWEDLSEQISEFLSDISLAKLISRKDITSICERQDNAVAELLSVRAAG